MMRPGSTKMIDDNVPAAEATVCTMLFSWMVASRIAFRIAIEITAAGIDVENVRPAFNPKYTFAAVNTIVMTMPMMTPRIVSSRRFGIPLIAFMGAFRYVVPRRTPLRGTPNAGLWPTSPPHGSFSPLASGEGAQRAALVFAQRAGQESGEPIRIQFFRTPTPALRARRFTPPLPKRGGLLPGTLRAFAHRGSAFRLAGGGIGELAARAKPARTVAAARR